MNNPLNNKCPVCGALVNAPCARINGTLMPGPHRKRMELTLGIKMPSRHEANQKALRKIQSA
jgi:hypothetical protein